MTIRIVEKNNKLAVHGIFDSIERAENHLRNIITIYISRGYFTNKSLTKDSFIIETNK